MQNLYSDIPVLYNDTANPYCKQNGFAVFNIMFGNVRFQTNRNIFMKRWSVSPDAIFPS